MVEFPPAPDPATVRGMNIDDVVELGFPRPPATFPLVWDPGDGVALRSRWDIEQRIAVLNVVLMAAFGADKNVTVSWLRSNGLWEATTAAERAFLSEPGIADEFTLHLEAVWALAWVLGIADELDPTQYAGEGLADWTPNVIDGETFDDWRLRSPVQIRPADEVAVLLDLHYCLDWGMVQAMRAGTPIPGITQPYVVGQRRWALEWAVLFAGPHHDEPLAWDKIEFGL